MKKTVLGGAVAALVFLGSACTFSHQAINSGGKTAYVVKGTSIYHCTAEQEKPVCTEIEEGR